MIIPELKPGIRDAKFIQLYLRISGNESLPVLAYTNPSDRITDLGLCFRTLKGLGLNPPVITKKDNVYIASIDEGYAIVGAGLMDFDGKLIDAHGAGVMHEIGPSLEHFRDLAKRDPNLRNIEYMVR